MRGRTPILAFLVSLLIVAPLAAQSGRPFTTEDALDVRMVRIADVSEDGRWVAATARTRRGRSGVDHFRFGDPTYVSPSLEDLVVLDARGGDVRSVFDEPVQVRNPSWSPDGSALAFYKLEGDAYQLFLYDRAAGSVRRLTLRTGKELSSVAPLEWRPDGSGLLVALRPEGWRENAREAFLDMTEGPVVVQDSRDDFLDWDRVRNLSNREIPALVDVADGTVSELAGETPLRSVRFDEEGSNLLYTAVVPLRTSYQRARGTEYTVYRMPLAGGEPQVVVGPEERQVRGEWNEAGDAFAWVKEGDVLLRRVAADSAVNLTKEHRTVVSDGDTTKLSFSLERWRADGGAVLVRSSQGYHVLDVAAGTLRLVYALQEDEDARPRLSVEGWSDDGRSVFLSTSEPDHWERGLARLDVASGSLETLRADGGVYGDWHLSDDGSRVVFRMSDGNAPDELYAADIRFRNVQRLTDMNPQLDGVALTRTELVDYLDVDGNRLYGILYYPYGYEAGKTYPLVTEVYERFFDNGYNENMNLVTARGWFGFRPSVDLEIGYPGEAWLKGVTPAINSLIERGLVDEDNVGVYGQSYGGYAVNLLVTQTDRFAAAANVSGKVNIISFLGDSEKITTRNYNAAEEGQDRIGATLWEQPQKYIAHSAVMFADRIKTPLLLLSGEGDWNVPATNQREMYYALRRLGKEVVWVNYMHGGHGAGRASGVEDFHDHWKRLLDWMGEHFEPDASR